MGPTGWTGRRQLINTTVSTTHEPTGAIATCLPCLGLALLSQRLGWSGDARPCPCQRAFLPPDTPGSAQRHYQRTMLRFVSATIVVAFWLLAMLGDQFATKHPGNGRLQVGIGIDWFTDLCTARAGVYFLCLWSILDNGLTVINPTSMSILHHTNKQTKTVVRLPPHRRCRALYARVYHVHRAPPCPCPRPLAAAGRLLVLFVFWWISCGCTVFISEGHPSP